MSLGKVASQADIDEKINNLTADDVGALDGSYDPAAEINPEDIGAVSASEYTDPSSLTLDDFTTDGRDIYIRQKGEADPTQNEGDIVFYYE